MNKKSKIENVILIFVIILLPIINGLIRIELSSFNPINGDFQNYNVIRRFLCGQIPFKDFAVYLGTGHLILLSFFQLIIGNTFTKSLFVTNFATMLCCEILTFIITFLILKNKKKSLYATLIFSLFNLVQWKFIHDTNNKSEVLTALNHGISPQLSARFIRVSIIQFLIILIYLGIHLINKLNKPQKTKILLKKIIFAIFAGSAIMWSNDGGVSAYISISFIYFLLLIKEHKKNILFIIRDTFMYIGISLASLAIFVTIITRGNPLYWLKFNFGVSSYQKWYFDDITSKYNLSLLDIFSNFFNIVSLSMVFLTIYYIIKLFKEKTSNGTITYAFLAFITLAFTLNSLIYISLSGGISKDILNLAFLIILYTYIILFIDKKIRQSVNKIKIYSILRYFIILLTVSLLILEVFVYILDLKKLRKNAIYIKELGGYLDTYSETIEFAKHKLGSDKIFSTYASAIEVATKQFQPSGKDYIIHVLGDKQREEYLDTFKEEDFKYVTILLNTKCKNWIESVNWFFYRELYKNYKPVFQTQYNMFMEKDESMSLPSSEDFSIELKKESDSTYIIDIEGIDEKFCGMADIKISYNSSFKKNFFKSLDINRYINVNDINSAELIDSIDFGIPNKSDCYYIPITILNGKGEVKISSYPLDNTNLEITNCELLNVFDVMFRYYCASPFSKSEGNTLYLTLSKEALFILNNAKQIKINDTTRNILSYEINAGLINIELDGNASEFNYPNYFEIIK